MFCTSRQGSGGSALPAGSDGLDLAAPWLQGFLGSFLGRQVSCWYRGISLLCLSCSFPLEVSLFFLHFYGLVGALKHPSAFPADGKGGAAGALWDTRGQRCPWEVAPGLLWLIQVWDWIYSSGIPSESARLGIVTAGGSEGA